MQSSLTSPRRTRTSNASKHPGLPDAVPKRRSHTEKLADDAERIEFQAMQHQKALLTLDTIASIEEDMEASQSTKRAAMKKGVRPAKKAVPVSAKASVAAADIPKTLCKYSAFRN